MWYEQKTETFNDHMHAHYGKIMDNYELLLGKLQSIAILLVIHLK